MTGRPVDNNEATSGMQDQQGTQPTAAGNGTAGSGQSLEEQLAAAQAEAAQYKDKYLREVAEKDNFRKRQERMSADRSRRDKLDVLEHVLEVTDNLDRALPFLNTMDRASLEQVVRMMAGQLNELLRAQGLTPIETVGQPFNPYVHEAIETIPSAQYPEGTVAEEVRKGYRQGDETVRPARVKVSSGPPKR